MQAPSKPECAKPPEGDFNPFKTEAPQQAASQDRQPPPQEKLLAAGISTPKFGSQEVKANSKSVSNSGSTTAFDGPSTKAKGMPTRP